ncbi:MAG: hypothetical protein ACYTXC_01960 [Nostoc sp.]
MPLFPSASYLEESKFIQLLDKKDSGVNGGQAIVTTWSNKDITVINLDETGEATLSNNLFILPSGIYEIDSRTTFYNLADTKIRLINVTDSIPLMYGINSYFNPGSDRGVALQSNLTGKFSIATGKQLALQYWCKSGSNLNQYNFGGSVGDGSPEIYT